MLNCLGSISEKRPLGSYYFILITNPPLNNCSLRVWVLNTSVKLFTAVYRKHKLLLYFTLNQAKHREKFEIRHQTLRGASNLLELWLLD